MFPFPFYFLDLYVLKSGLLTCVLHAFDCCRVESVSTVYTHPVYPLFQTTTVLRIFHLS